MTQPPDDRPPRGDEPEGDAAPENAPTVAWTPPDAEPERPTEEGGVGYAAMPGGSEATTPPPAAPPGPSPEPPPPDEPAVPTPPPPAPAGPIISATPATPPSSTGWQAPGQPEAPAMPPPVAPAGGSDVPAAPAVPQQEGYVIAGVGARFVAWLIDIFLVGWLPFTFTLLFFDWQSLLRTVLEQARQSEGGRVTNFEQIVIPISIDFLLATLISVAISYLYFVGFWTSRWRATPGMIGLKLRLVDAASGGTLSILQATKRWFILGWPLGLLILVPALQSATSLLQFGLALFLFFTTVTNDQKQGLHDKWSNSLMIRSVTSGDGATVVGCLVWGVLIILFFFVVFSVMFAAAIPIIQEYVRQNPQLT
jgi:uncharacterized RDD family membrane protein YckC